MVKAGGRSGPGFVSERRSPRRSSQGLRTPGRGFVGHRKSRRELLRRFEDGFGKWDGPVKTDSGCSLAGGPGLFQQGPRLCIEVAVQRDGEPGQLRGVREHLALVQKDLADAILGRVALGLETVKPLGLVRLIGLEHQSRQALECLGVSGTLAHHQLKFAPFGLSIPLKLGQPCPEGVEFGLCHLPGRVVGGRRPETSDVSFDESQVEVGPPHRRIIWPPVTALAQPPGGIGELAGQEGEPGTGKPDAVIVAIGHLEGRAPRFHRHRRMVQEPEFTEHSRGVRAAAPGPAKYPADVIEPPLEAVEPAQACVPARSGFPWRGELRALSRISSAGEYFPEFTRCVAWMRGGTRIVRTVGTDLGPSGQCLAATAPAQLAFAEQQVDFALVRPVSGESSEPLAGRDKMPSAHLQPGLSEFLAPCPAAIDLHAEERHQSQHTERQQGSDPPAWFAMLHAPSSVSVNPLHDASEVGSALPQEAAFSDHHPRSGPSRAREGRSRVSPVLPLLSESPGSTAESHDGFCRPESRKSNQHPLHLLIKETTLCDKLTCFAHRWRPRVTCSSRISMSQVILFPFALHFRCVSLGGSP